MFAQQSEHLLVGLVDDAPHFLIDELLRLLRRCSRSGQERSSAVHGQDRDRPHHRAHPPAADHLPRNAGELLQVRLGARRQLPVDEILGGASAKSDLDQGEQILLVVAVPILLRRGQRDPERRAASRAASLTRFARSAPTMPVVLAATLSSSTSSASGTARVWTSRIRWRPARSGGCTATRRSKRPGRSSAASRMSGRFVAAITITSVEGSKPSISVRIWLSVCSRSSPPPPPTCPADRDLPIESSSSMNTIAGDASFAFLKRSRTREAPTPTIASMNSDADIEKNGTSASPATARASSVLPVPGGPPSRTPRGIRPPRRP